MRTMRWTMTVLLAVASPGAALAAPDCPLPPGLSGWSQKAPAAATLAIGRAATVTLRPATAVRYALPPERPGGFGTVLDFTVTRAGRYRVALGSAAWIDLVADGRAVASIAHGHGPACSGVRKTVDFALVPGRHRLQIAAGDAGPIDLLIAAIP